MYSICAARVCITLSGIFQACPAPTLLLRMYEHASTQCTRARRRTNDPRQILVGGRMRAEHYLKSLYTAAAL
jgi:hypothetical protein